MGGSHRCPRGISFSLSCHSWSGCCQWDSGWYQIWAERCDPLLTDNWQGINWPDVTSRHPLVLRTQAPAPGADLVSSCTADWERTETGQPRDLSQEDGYRILTLPTLAYNRISSSNWNGSSHHIDLLFINIFSVADHSCCEYKKKKRKEKKSNKQIQHTNLIL